MTLYEQEAEFRRGVIERAVVGAHGNRTVAAERLGLAEKYLKRLIRDLAAHVPPPRFGRAAHRRNA